MIKTCFSGSPAEEYKRLLDYLNTKNSTMDHIDHRQCDLVVFK